MNLCRLIVAVLIVLIAAPLQAQDEVRILRRGGAGDPESLDPHKLMSALLTLVRKTPHERGAFLYLCVAQGTAAFSLGP